MDLLLGFGVIGNMVDLAMFGMFSCIVQVVQFPQLVFFDHVPPSVLLSLGWAANFTPNGVDRDVPFQLGETPIVTDLSILNARPLLIGSGSSVREWA